MYQKYLKLAAGIIRIQSIGILVFALVTLVGALATQDIDSWTTLVTELIIYLFFVVVMWLIARGLMRGNNRAFGPYVLTQLFLIIIAWPLATEGQLATRVLGVIAGLSTLAALYLVFSKTFREEFFEI
ncbi:MAG: hypothetical protein ACO3JY_04865 [Candidatus Nanopelagicales bacterium]